MAPRFQPTDAGAAGRRRLAAGALALAVVAPTMPRSCDTAVVIELPRTAVPECPEGRRIAGVCAGVPPGPVCSDEACTADVACSQTVKVDDDPTLQAALTVAKAGTCIALGPGVYGDAAVPGGVSLLGVGAESVEVASVVVGAGEKSVLRGFAVAGGILLQGAMHTRIVSVRVTGSAGDGVEVGSDSSVAVETSEIGGAARYGIGAFDSGDVQATESVIEGAEGGGLWMSCTAECDCAAVPTLLLDKVILQENHRVGVSVVGVAARLTDVRIDRTTTDKSFDGGFGLAASGCADLEALGLRVVDSSANGVLIDKANARLGAEGAGRGVNVDRNIGGIWIQHISTAKMQSVRLESVGLSDNSAVGIGIAGQSSGVVIRGAVIHGTETITLPSGQGTPGGSVEVGDGLVWLDHSFADIDGLRVGASARASVLIDGQVATGSKLSHVTLVDGDEEKGIVQQSCPAGGTAPEVGPETPPIKTTSGTTFELPWN